MLISRAIHLQIAEDPVWRCTCVLFGAEEDLRLKTWGGQKEVGGFFCEHKTPGCVLGCRSSSVRIIKVVGDMVWPRNR